MSQSEEHIAAANSQQQEPPSNSPPAAVQEVSAADQALDHPEEGKVFQTIKIDDEPKIAAAAAESSHSQSGSIVPSISTGFTAPNLNIQQKLQSLDEVFRVTKQFVLEKMGKVQASEDPQLHLKLTQLQDKKNDYDHLIELGNKLVEQMITVTETSKQINKQISQIGSKDLDNYDLLQKLGESYRAVIVQSHKHIPEIKSVYANLATLKDIAFEDTLETAKKCDRSRLEYDAFKTKLLEMEEQEKRLPSPRGKEKKAQLQADVEQFKQKYESLRDDTITKLDLLNHKRNQVLRLQLDAYIRSMLDFYSTTSSEVQSVLQKKPASPPSSPDNNNNKGAQ